MSATPADVGGGALFCPLLHDLCCVVAMPLSSPASLALELRRRMPLGLDAPTSAEVLIDATALDTGHRDRGIGRYVHGLIQAMGALERSPEAALLRLHPDASPLPRKVDVKAQGPSDAAIDSPFPTWTLRRPRTTHLGRFLLNELRLARELRRCGAKLYHATEPWSAPVGPGFKTVITCHDLIPLQFPEHYMGKGHRYWQVYHHYMGLRDRWRALDHIIAISEATATELKQRFNVPDERITVVPNGIDHGHFKPASPVAIDELKQRFNLKSPFALYLGGYDFRKNTELLIRALAQLSSSTELTLVLAGGVDAQMRAAHDALAKKLGQAHRLRWLGFVDDRDLPALYGAADFFVYPSLAEGFGLQALEAMACGCPVIASDRSSLPEVVGDAALLANPGSAYGWGESMSALLKDTPLRERLREAGLKRAQDFSWERCARETAAVYERLLASTF
ncbi:glycosyltransferase family 1 protein [Lujinxingia sediminis]|uniref:Glycosyltransferase family 1 protein n=2 Tax=Lujinxingia sediminis TaxID=2480984 RepID=A0ABY0CYZ9_9DELT|nr:glycosyltransferase family 1 protein [Lujinxingia sediminis]